MIVTRVPSDHQTPRRHSRLVGTNRYDRRAVVARPLPFPLDGCLPRGGLSSLSIRCGRAVPFLLGCSGPLLTSTGAGFQSLNFLREALLPISRYSALVTACCVKAGFMAKATPDRYASRIGLGNGCQREAARRCWTCVLFWAMNGDGTVDGGQCP